MKLLTAQQIREADQYTIKNEPIASIDLMERAAQKCTNWIINNLYTHKHFVIFTGPGNNGGDGLAIARQLAAEGFKCHVLQVKFTDKLSPDSQENLKRLKQQKLVDIDEIKSENDLPEIDDTTIIIDAIFGSGLSRPVEGLVKNINHFINGKKNKVISIDIPSGLFSEDNSKNDYEAIVKADFTLTFQLPKISFFNAEDNLYTGKVVVLDIGLDQDFIGSCQSDYHMIDLKLVKPLIKTRSIFSHKGTYGHALLIAGSKGKMGAAVLSARAGLKTGCGLITMYTPGCGLNIVQTAFPEAMVNTDKDENYISNFPDTKNFSSIGLGPGMGTQKTTAEAFEKFLKNHKKPIIVDADGLNILSENKKLLKILPKNAILTPHPKEFNRLFGKLPGSGKKLEFIRKISNKYNLIIVFKEAFTKIALPNGYVYINQSGNLGIATAGSGDGLTGMLLSLLAQDYDPKEAAIVGVYLHGLAGDLYSEHHSEEALTASDIINNIGNAFKTIKKDDA